MSRAVALLALSEARDAMTLAIEALRHDDVEAFVAQLERANELLEGVATETREAA